MFTDMAVYGKVNQPLFEDWEPCDTKLIKNLENPGSNTIVK